MKILITFILLFCAGCYQSQITNGIPNFKIVDSISGAIFRGGQPNQDGMFYLKSLGIKTIIELNGDAPELDSLEMDIFPVHLSGFFSPSKHDMNRIEHDLETLPKPLFIHCKEGRDRTGLAIAIYRVKVDGWSKQKAYDEWTKYGRHFTDWFLEAYFWNN